MGPAEPVEREVWPVVMVGEAQVTENRTVLVVEDDPDVRTVEVLMLRDLGCVACVARDALEALALVRSLGGRVALVLACLDIEPFDGLELARRLAVDLPDVGVILSYCSAEDLDGRPLPPNVRGMLVKPFDLAVAGDVVRASLPR